ncbi:GYD domain-containing protein [Micromonospora sp. WP24]|uniref:GYD domain-containing protein n=1 Tax=Micromonospora TaxID=1873 RepID=UPI0011DB686C|nr:GYD domain-containing protein [Micromonospora sp. WP24]TYC07150.1 GYD domain-containing protein [Micromonospora sp. WP24]
MAKFLLKSTYTVDGVKGLMKDGGSKRAAAATKAIEGLGGRVESLSFGLGEHDTYVVCELPDHKTAAALAIAIRAAGGVDTRVTPLLTPEEVDEATRQQLKYQSPGA